MNEEKDLIDEPLESTKSHAASIDKLATDTPEVPPAPPPASTCPLSSEKVMGQILVN